MSVLDDLIKATAERLSSTQSNGLWSNMDSSTTGNVSQASADVVIDAILNNTKFRNAYEVGMLILNQTVVAQNEGYGRDHIIPDTLSFFAGSLLDSVVTASVIADEVSKGLLDSVGMRSYVENLNEKAFIEPNIEGVPISAERIVTTSEVDVAEQLLIAQEQSQKQYWTDNAVPKLRTWQISGYLSSILSLDNAFIIKPSLDIQEEFLNKCAQSRRPVLFKTNRGKFVYVQITSLQTDYDPTYNNKLKIDISLIEYKPFVVNAVTALITQASETVPEIGGDNA